MSRYVLFEDVITELAKHMMWEAEIESPYASDNIEDWKQCACMELKAVPTADAVPIVHGYWIIHESEDYVEPDGMCSNCGAYWVLSDTHYFDYCPHCGARMDGEVK